MKNNWLHPMGGWYLTLVNDDWKWSKNSKALLWAKVTVGISFLLLFFLVIVMVNDNLKLAKIVC